MTDADAFFQVELPALQEWTFTRETAGRISQPILAMGGAESAPAFKEAVQLLKEWYPRADEVVVPDAGHTLQMVNAPAVAQGLARFYAAQRAKK